MEKVFTLTMEIEELAGIRNYKILAVSKNEDTLIEKLKEYKEKDEFGILEKNGIEYGDEVCLISNYRDSKTNCYIAYFIECHIME